MKYYLDCEFNGYRGDLISMALVREDGQELYLAWPRNDCIPWVAENVVPIIECSGASPHIHRIGGWSGMIETFLHDDICPTIIADWPDDIRYLCECLVTGPGEMIDIPTYWNSPPGTGPRPRDIRFVVKRIDAYPTDLPGAVQHNALWDARALRHKLRDTPNPERERLRSWGIT